MNLPRVVGLAAVAAAALLVGACGGEVPQASPDLTPQQQRGLQIAQSSGCASCHGAGFVGGVGPTWVGLAGKTITLADGSTVVADATYLTEAIAEPGAKLLPNYTIAMPKNALSDVDIADIVAYIESLAD